MTGDALIGMPALFSQEQKVQFIMSMFWLQNNKINEDLMYQDNGHAGQLEMLLERFNASVMDTKRPVVLQGRIRVLHISEKAAKGA